MRTTSIWVLAAVSMVTLASVSAMANSCTNNPSGATSVPFRFTIDAPTGDVDVFGTLFLDGICQTSTSIPTFQGWQITSLTGSAEGNKILLKNQYSFSDTGNTNDNLFDIAGKDGSGNPPAVSGNAAFEGGFAFGEYDKNNNFIEGYSFFWNPSAGTYQGCWTKIDCIPLTVSNVSFTPEPSSITLLGSATAGLAGLDALGFTNFGLLGFAEAIRRRLKK